MFIFLIILYIGAISNISTVHSHSINKAHTLVYCIGIIIIGTFAFFTDDYEPYIYIIHNLHLGYYWESHLEPLWLWVVKGAEGEINLFRFISFLLITIILMIEVRLLNLKADKFISYYYLLCLAGTLCWIRQPFAISIFITGVLILKNKKILGSLMIISVYFIHKSSLILYLMLILYTLPLNKKVILIEILSIPLAFSLFNPGVEFLSQLTGIELKYYISDSVYLGDRHILIRLLNFIALASNYALITYVLILAKKSGIEKRYSKLLWISMYLSIIFLILPMGKQTITTRLLGTSMFIISIILSKIMDPKELLKKHKLLLSCIILVVTTTILESIAFNISRLDNLIRIY